MSQNKRLVDYSLTDEEESPGEDLVCGQEDVLTFGDETLDEILGPWSPEPRFGDDTLDELFGPWSPEPKFGDDTLSELLGPWSPEPRDEKEAPWIAADNRDRL
jgi:hypothetical protein